MNPPKPPPRYATVIEQYIIVNVFLSGNPYEKLPYGKCVDDTVQQAGETDETRQAV